jgi:DNA-binding transcriptional LysR family regulator
MRSIVATHAVISYILLAPLMQYQEQHPEVRFDLVGDDVHLDLVRHDADIVIRPVMDLAPGIKQIPLFTLVKKLYASQSYLDRHGEPQTAEDLDQHALISFVDRKLYPHTDIEWILKVSAPLGKKRQAKYTANQLETIMNYASQGFGIVGAYTMMKHVRNANLIDILPDVSSEPVHCTLCTSESQASDPEVERLKDHLLKAFTNEL